MAEAVVSSTAVQIAPEITVSKVTVMVPSVPPEAAVVAAGALPEVVALGVNPPVVTHPGGDPFFGINSFQIFFSNYCFFT